MTRIAACSLFVLSSVTACYPAGLPGLPQVQRVPFASISTGAHVRAYLVDGSRTEGDLVRPFSLDSDRVLLCESVAQCSALDTTTARSIPIDAIDTLDVRGRMTTNFSLAGVFLGGLVGGGLPSPDGEPHPARAAVGALLGAGAGALLGARVTSWSRVLPCYDTCPWIDVIYPVASHKP